MVSKGDILLRRPGGTPGIRSFCAYWVYRFFTRRNAAFSFSIFFLVAAALFVLTPGISFAATESTESPDQDPARSTVFVIDVSTSMYDIVDDLKSALKEYIGESKLGQSIAVVTFGASSRLLYRRTIRSEADIERLLDDCDKLSCDDEYTFIPSGLNAGVNELYQFYQDNPSGAHDLVLMSDGRNNPPRGIEEDSMMSYDLIKEKYFSDFRPGRDWYITYIALKGIPDVELRDFVEECRGNMLILRPSEEGEGYYEIVDSDGISRKVSRRLALTISEADIFPGAGLDINGENIIRLGNAITPIKVTIPLLIAPRRGNPHGKSLKIMPILTDLGSGTQLLAEVFPPEIACGTEPRELNITLKIDGNWDKAIAGALLFKPIGQSIFIVHPTQLRFQFEKPPKLFVGRYDPELDHEYKPLDWLALGPLEPGGECSGKIAIKLGDNIPLEGISIEATPDITLPAGVTCTTEVNLGGLFSKTAHIKVIVEAAADADLEEGRQFTGTLRLTNPERTVSLSQSNIPLKVFALNPEMEADWRQRNRDYTAEVNYDWKMIGLIIVTPALLVILVSAFGVVRFRAYLNRFVPAEGWLVAFEYPVDFDVENLDLRLLSEKLKKSKLILGSDPECDIQLSHDSVDKKHAEIRSGREGSPTPMYIKSIGLSDIKIHNYLIDSEVKLQDRDLIEIGAFQFIYSNSHMKQIVVHYKDGDVKYGIPLTWNIEEDGFVLRPEREGAEAMQMYIPFKDLKGVFFVKDFDEEIAKKIKLPILAAKKDYIVASFKDGETIKGYTMKDYDPKAPRFLLIPKEDPGKETSNICILIERKATEKIKVIKEHA